MATVISEYADRLDIVAVRVYGALTEVATDALFRANTALPLAMQQGLAIEVPDTPETLNYGGTFPGWDYDALLAVIAAHPQQGDFLAADFNPLDWSTEI